MNITLRNTGKRYNREWIFRNVDLDFIQGNTYAITGSNGSGKSTLLQNIAGATMATEGKIQYLNNSHIAIADNLAYQQISIAAPYLELIEEMTAIEFLNFHSTFKMLTQSVSEILLAVGLENAGNKQIRYYSSGMKQRLKLAQAFFSKASVLLLDEPTTNLDESGIQLYKSLISKFTKDRLVIVCSNDKNEYEFCKNLISVEQYKKLNTF